MGWGVTSNAPGAHTVQVMNRVDLHVADAKMCRRVDETFDSNNGPFICTGTQPGNKDECNGDSGSPAIITMVNGRPRTIQETAPGRLSRQQDLGPVADMRLIGLTSYGDNADHDPHPPCGDPSGFGFSTHIAYYTDFILQATGLTKDRLQEPIKFDRLAEAPKPSGGARAVDPMAGLHLWLIIALVASWLLRR
ncbi:hypothetical protein DL89DRAFT_130446 [Linderina pennispora]|uniref:Peptidase S1 domain-containing protein n=1 Tax=Linderina pennispora TaxID=61395 RepID=A0A1Y1WDR3_9FUNG|nr:uncharacterized protein DL89DRAFT_130446 [Linderina pennispora]ORX71669.1 hypothetical protein DL89DRAFT_130446 [Linderina pennispora]